MRSIVCVVSSLWILSILLSSAAAGECEACIKVLDDVKAMLGKENASNKPKIEAALGKYCERTTLSSKEKKICYYMYVLSSFANDDILTSFCTFISDPIKRDVAQPFSLGMPSLKVCQRISKSNPEICTVKLPVNTDKMEKKDISKLRVKQLKQILADRGVECKGCVEKDEFVKRVQETEHLAGSDEF